jgi:cytochrome c-type biogenesis protein CcmH/NrfG
MNITQNIQKKLDLRQYKNALDQCTQQLESDPENTELWYLLSEIHLQTRAASKALTAIEKATALQPSDPKLLLQLANCLLATQNTTKALELAQTLMQTPLKSAQYHADLALLLNRLDLNEQSKQHYERAISYQPDDASLHYNLATAQRFLGEFNQANESLEKAIALNPKDYEAIALRSQIIRQTPSSNHVPQLETLLNSNIEHPPHEVQVCYALAKELEDIDESKKSFHYLKRGADLRRSYMQYNVEVDLEIMAAIQQVYNRSMCNDNVIGDKTIGHPSPEPIFIIGLPRTGTTLLERILGSHSQTFAAGELNNFAAQMMQLVRQQFPQSPSRIKLVEQTADIDFNQLGQSYIDSTRPQTGHTAHFIDKLPLNFLYAGLIHRALPNAKIIHLTRNPMDACYAIYKCLFKQAYPFSYNLDDLAQYYIAHHRLMNHWHEVMPGVIHQLSYEQLVNDTEQEAKKLLDYCELPWEEQCLRFYENKSATKTASAAQIRQPVYQSSLERWKNYEEQLQPLKNLLEKAGIKLDF